MLALMFPSVMYATTVVNVVQVEAVSGGKTLNGADGKDGAPGKAGQGGGVGGASVSIEARSEIDGKTVIHFATSTKTTSSDRTGYVSSSEFSFPTTTEPDVVVQNVAAGLAQPIATNEQFEGVREILNAISLIVMSYVAHLF